MGTTRRVVLGSLGAAGALLVGWSFVPPRQRLAPAEPLPAIGGRVPLNGWVRIGPDDRIGVVVPRAEMGQGVHTAAAMLLAEELDVDLAQVLVEPAPVDAIYNNVATFVDNLPLPPVPPGEAGPGRRLATWMTAKTMREIGLIVTGGSSSVKDLWLPMRRAGASARAMLLAAAAARWQVSAAELRVAAGEVTHARSGRSVRYGELAAAAAALPLPREVPLKSHKQFTLIGREVPRLEARAKIARGERPAGGGGTLGTAGTAGTAGPSATSGSSGPSGSSSPSGPPGERRGEAGPGFGLDVVLPGMLYATVRHAPTLGARVASLAGAKAMALPGVKTVFALEGRYGGAAGVAVIADTPWHALKAARAIEVTWDDEGAEASPGSAAGFDSRAALARLVARLDDRGGTAFLERGDAEAALAGAARTLQADYTAPWLAHAALEPLNCTVQFKDGRATVWAGTQVSDLARRAAARALGLRFTEADKVEVNVTWVGGAFGRRLEVDYIAEAAAIARQAPDGAPVQTFWTREEDFGHDFYRPACAARLRAGFDASGRVVGFTGLSAGQAPAAQMMARLFRVPAFAAARFDKTTCEGAFDQAYEWPAARVAHAAVELPVPVGMWRSVGHSHHAFFLESFVDELAAAAGADPVAFRLALLQRHPRHAAVLRLVAEKAGWGQPVPPAPDGAKAARGVALHESFGSIVAQVAEVSLAPAGADRTIRVHRVVCVVDCGLPVNPAHVRQQMEGGIVFGLTAALHGGIEIARGRVTASNFHDQPLVRIDTCPAIETHIIASALAPEGAGEPGTPPIAPAVANALFALTGQRLRSLPLKWPATDGRAS